MKTKLQKLKQEILEQLKKALHQSKLGAGQAADVLELEKIEKKYLGRKGELTMVLKSIASLSAKEKKEVGKLANEIREEINKKLAEIKKKLSDQSKGDQFIDITLPGEKVEQGHLHPITLVQRELEKVFRSMGFMVLDGPELESDYYNFEALNIPKTHPARDMQDTFYIRMATPKENKFPTGQANSRQIATNTNSGGGESDLVMRTHTSPVQVRAMEKYGAPLRCVVPGRVFRCEATDACHEHTFEQMEGLMIDENISLANLIAVMKELIDGIFRKDMEIRIRPGYFPFVEPGLELDINCTICGGKGCSSCKNSGWLELLPSGLVHPNVLRAGKIDPKKYSGFAFGLGLTRLAMMKYGIDDIRLFNSGDLHFLSQFHE